MPTHQFQCDDCKLYWEITIPISELPGERECPECGQLREKTFLPLHIIFKGPGFETNRAKAERFNKYGLDKDSANEFYKEHMKASKERMKTGGQHYKIWEPNVKKMEKEGLLKKVSDKRRIEKIQMGRNLTKELVRKLNKKK